MIFVCPFALSSLVTGPKILVPTGSPLSSIITTALLSNLTEVPSFLCIEYLVLTTTAFWTEPFLTFPLGRASLTLITILSPIGSFCF